MDTTITQPPILETGVDPVALLNELILRDLYDSLRLRWAVMDTYDAYMKGNHPLTFATEKFKNAFGELFRELADNLCPRVIETLKNKTILEGMDYKGSDSLKLDDLFTTHRMDCLSSRIHEDAYRYGDAYVIVAEVLGRFPNSFRLYRQSPRNVRVMHDPEDPQRLALAIKVWQELGNFWRLNIYTPSHTYRYGYQGPNVSPNETADSMSQAPSSLKQFQLLADGILINLFGMIPIWHFPNKPDVYEQGVSELVNVIPLQNLLNKTICDMAVNNEFYAVPQRWATGIEVEYDAVTGKPKAPVTAGADRLLFSGSEDAKFGTFDAGHSESLIATLQDIRMEIGRVSGIPLHHLMLTAQAPSGEALKTAEQPLCEKVADREQTWGDIWENMFAYLLASPEGDPNLEAEWKPVYARSRQEEATADKAEAEAIDLKVQIGISRTQALKELGYTDEQIKQFEADRAAEHDLKVSQQEQLLSAVGGNPASPTYPNR